MRGYRTLFRASVDGADEAGSLLSERREYMKKQDSCQRDFPGIPALSIGSLKGLQKSENVRWVMASSVSMVIREKGFSPPLFLDNP